MSTEPDGESYLSDEDETLVVVGQTGRPGHDGKPGGEGKRGRAGEPGRDGAASFLSRTQVLTLFTFVVVIFLLLAYRSEIQADAIRNSNQANRVRVYEQCQVSRENAASLTAVLDQIVISVRRRTDIPPAIKAEYIRVYTAAIPKVVDCGTRP